MRKKLFYWIICSAIIAVSFLLSFIIPVSAGILSMNGYLTPLVGATKPTGEGLHVGTLYFDVNADTWEKCTSIDPETWVPVSSGGATLWGSITGTLSNQTDLNNALNGKLGTALTSAYIFVGNGSDVATGVLPSQDVSLVSTGAFTVTGIQTKAVPSLSAGFLKYSGSAWAFDSSTYLTGNQNITLSGDLSGSGTTSISGTVTGIQSKAITLATGFLNYTGSAWAFSSVMTNPMTTLGDIVYENNVPAPARLAGNTVNSKYFLTSTASGGVAQAPAWGTLVSADIPATLANTTTITGLNYLTLNAIADASTAGKFFLSSTTANALKYYDVQGSPILHQIATLDLTQTFGSGSTWNGGLISGQYGGTGVANTGKTITLGGNLTTSGAFATAFTMTGITGVTFPTSGTLVATDVTTLSSLASIGTITTGVWNSGTQIGVLYGGTGLKTVLAGSILAANTLDTLTAITSTSGVYYLKNDTGTISWATVGGGSNALLDGSSHIDTTAVTVARGDVITGQTATPKWTRLAKGTANQVLAMDATGTDVLWVTPVGGSNPAWYGKFYDAKGNCDPISQALHDNMLSVSGPTPTGIGITVGRSVQFIPPANITVTHIRLFGTGATTNLYKFAIYPVGTGSAKIWDSGTQTTAANTWKDITSGLPVTLTAGTKYWWCVTTVATGTTAGFRSEAAPLGTNYWGAAATAGKVAGNTPGDVTVN